jgi:hypothetical protein
VLLSVFHRLNSVLLARHVLHHLGFELARILERERFVMLELTATFQRGRSSRLLLDYMRWDPATSSWAMAIAISPVALVTLVGACPLLRVVLVDGLQGSVRLLEPITSHAQVRSRGVLLY